MNIRFRLLISLIVLFIVLPAFIVSGQCNEELVEKAINNNGMDALFIREFKIMQGYEKKKKQKRAISVAKYNVRLHQGIIYRFNVETDQQSQTKAILQLRKDNLIFGSTYDTDNQSDICSFDFLCPEGSQYQVILSFLDGNPGCAVGIMSAVISDSTVTKALMDSTRAENVLYAGVDNYIDIASSTNPNGTLKVSITKGTVDKEGGLYRVYVKEEGPVTINVIALDSLGKTTETFKKEFTVQNRAMPSITLLGLSGGLIRKSELINSYSYLQVNSWTWSESYRVKTFTIAESLTSVGISSVNTNTLSSRQLDLIKNLKQGETFYIKDIVVEEKKGQVFNLPPLGFIISD